MKSLSLSLSPVIGDVCKDIPIVHFSGKAFYSNVQAVTCLLIWLDAAVVSHNAVVMFGKRGKPHLHLITTGFIIQLSFEISGLISFCLN